jgi:hypothetical protein
MDKKGRCPESGSHRGTPPAFSLTFRLCALLPPQRRVSGKPARAIMATHPLARRRGAVGGRRRASQVKISPALRQDPSCWRPWMTRWPAT